MNSPLKYPLSPGQTPLNPNEHEGLIPGHIQLISELNEFEESNINQAIKKYLLGNRHYNLTRSEVLKKIHQDMFDQTWKWAGMYRHTNKNLGMNWPLIPEEVQKTCDDLNYWNKHYTYSPHEIAARVHHRFVSIHPFSNGNGRWSRLVADIYLKQEGEKQFTWGTKDPLFQNENRKTYIQALQMADQGNLELLIKFAKS